MMAQYIWNGTPLEIKDLIAITERICQEAGSPCHKPGRTTCGAHDLLVESQERLNALLFVRRIADRLRDEEWKQ